MIFSKKLVMCVAFLCVASFAKQSATIKTVTTESKVAVTVTSSDSKKTMSNVNSVNIPKKSTWTSLKQLFE